jgi:hypothetical protein
MLVSGQGWPLQKPVALGQAIAAASRDPPGPRRQPAPCTASPAAAAHRDRRHNTEGGLDRSIPVLTREALQMAARPPSLPEPPPLPAKPTPPQPSKWWTLLLIIPAIATGLAVVASQFLRRRWTNWQARLAGHLDLLGDYITQWSRRASRPVQIDPTLPCSERPSPSNRPSSSLTTFDPKSLRRVVN